MKKIRIIIPKRHEHTEEKHHIQIGVCPKAD